MARWSYGVDRVPLGGGKHPAVRGNRGRICSPEVNVLATWGTATAVAAKNATSVIPIVFTVVGDPVGSGLVASLARPGSNVTGLSTQHADAAGKRIELLREIVPNLRRLAVLAKTANSGSMKEMREV